MQYDKNELKTFLRIDEDTWRFFRNKNVIPDPAGKLTVGAAVRDIWTTEQVRQIIEKMASLQNVLQGSIPSVELVEEVVQVSPFDIEQISNLFVQYGNQNQPHLFYFLGLNTIPGIKATPIGARVSENGVEFLIGFSGSKQALASLSNKIGKGKSKHSRLVPLEDGVVLNGVDIEVSATVDNKHINEVLEGLRSGFAGSFSPTFFAVMKEVFPWQGAKKQTPQMTETVIKYKARAETELKALEKKESNLKNQEKTARYRRILETVEQYFKLPYDTNAFRQSRGEAQVARQTAREAAPKKGEYRPRFPSGWRPVLARTNDECEIVNQMNKMLGCEPPAVYSTETGRKNPIHFAGEGNLSVNGYPFSYKLDVVSLSDVITSHDDELNRISDYPNDFRPQPISTEDYEGVEDLERNIVPEVMCLPGPTDQGPPLVWGNGQKLYVLDGNLRTIALRRAAAHVKSKYFDCVFSITGKRGLLVRKLVGNRNKALQFVELTRAATPMKNSILMVGNPGHQETRENPMLMVGNPKQRQNPMLMVGNPKQKRNPMLMVGNPRKNTMLMVGNPTGATLERPKAENKKKTKQEIDYGDAVPIDQLPDSVKNQDAFKKSWKLFKDRYGADPNCAYPVKGPHGIAEVLAGIGEMKQLDYWAAEDANKPHEWIHWYHEAGERGEGIPFTRPCIVAACPFTGGVLLVSPEGADVKFTKKGIVG